MAMRRPLQARRCGDTARLNELLDRIEALGMVNRRVRIDDQHNDGSGRLQVKLWCSGQHSKRQR